jgi:hypothetical protein
MLYRLATIPAPAAQPHPRQGVLLWGSFNGRTARLGIEVILTPPPMPRGQRYCRTGGRHPAEGVSGPHDHCERAAPVQGLAGVRSPLQLRATSPLTGVGDSNGAPGSRWATRHHQDRCPARAWWPPSRVRVGSRLTCVDTDEILGPHTISSDRLRILVPGNSSRDSDGGYPRKTTLVCPETASRSSRPIQGGQHRKVGSVDFQAANKCRTDHAWERARFTHSVRWTGQP